MNLEPLVKLTAICAVVAGLAIGYLKLRGEA